MIYEKNKVEALRRKYPEGTRICLDHMGYDPQPIPDGSVGTVIGVDDAGHILMKWDSGRSLSLIPGIDEFHVIR